jgi:uncharacterized membrane protein
LWEVLAIATVSAILKALVSLNTVYVLTGLVLLVFATLNFKDRSNKHRNGTALFWLILGLIFILGSVLPYWLTGLLVLVMVGIDGAGRVGHKHTDVTKSGQVLQKVRSLGNRIFLVVLTIPLVTFGFAIAFRLLGLNTNDGAIVGLGFSGIVAIGVGLGLTKGTVAEAFGEGRRLNDAMGTVNILPPLLASLGIIFTASKIGDLIAAGIHKIIPGQNLFLLIVANCVGMALFTMVMGNSFAAFPVIAAGVLVPLIVKPFGVNPALVAIMTLTAGSTGTLMTPMAANFNIVPTALLDMRDQYGVIKFQTPFALTILAFHVIVMWLLIRMF